MHWALKLIPNTACVFVALPLNTPVILCKYSTVRTHRITCFQLSLWTMVINLLKQLLFSCWSDIPLLFLTPTPHYSRLALLVIYPWCWMVDYVPQRPVRGGTLSLLATATIHHANLEQEHCAQVCYSVHYYYPLVKNSKKFPANSSRHFLEKGITDINWEMRHRWESMEAATGPMSAWAHNFDNPHQSCPTSPVPNTITVAGSGPDEWLLCDILPSPLLKEVICKSASGPSAQRFQPRDLLTGPIWIPMETISEQQFGYLPELDGAVEKNHGVIYWEENRLYAILLWNIFIQYMKFTHWGLKLPS